MRWKRTRRSGPNVAPFSTDPEHLCRARVGGLDERIWRYIADVFSSRVRLANAHLHSWAALGVPERVAFQPLASLRVWRGGI